MNNTKRFLAKLGVGAFGVVALCVPFLAHADMLTRQLDIGATGSDVSALQTFLAQDPSIYPQGLVTGYFGTLTAAAVSNFQVRNGLEGVGRVGPLTLALLNSKMSGTVTVNSGSASPAISAVTVNSGTNSVTVNWNTNEYAKGMVYYSTSPLSTYEYPNSVTVSGNTAMTDNNFHASQNVLITGLQPNTVYYYMVYTTDQAGNVSVTWPSTFQTTN